MMWFPVDFPQEPPQSTSQVPCLAVDPVTGAVCSQMEHEGRHNDRSDPGCELGWNADLQELILV